MEQFIISLDSLTSQISNIIATPLIPILLGSGLIVTISLRFIQIKRLKHSFDVLTGKYDTIRCSIAYSNAPCVIVGTHSGMAIGKDGVTREQVGIAIYSNKNQLLGDSTKAKEKLNWEPKITLNQLISEMIEEDLKEAKKEALLNKEGFTVTSPKE